MKGSKYEAERMVDKLKEAEFEVFKFVVNNGIDGNEDLTLLYEYLLRKIDKLQKQLEK
jgi:hypothetical protein